MTSSRLIKRGDIVRVEVPTGGEVEEVVRDVSVLLNLANGMVIQLHHDADVEVLPPERLDDTLVEQVQAIRDEESQADVGKT